MSDSALSAQYEAYPYPARSAKDEAKRLITGSPSRLAEIDHYLFQGKLDLKRPFRALIAGGGTGDAAVMLAQQLKDAGAERAEVVYLDLSRASRAIAESRIAARGLTNVQFSTGSFLALEALALGSFDYIDCCGVLHHLKDPTAGLAALADALTPDGGLGVMVYAPYGRTGVYPLQDALRSLGGTLPLPEQVGLAKRVLASLPETNWLKRNPFLQDHRKSDAELVDLLLHVRDRAYSVPEFLALVEGAGLHLASFIEPLRYEPAKLVADAELRRRFAELDEAARAAVAEQLAGNLRSHIAYLSRRTHSVAHVEGPDSVPVLIELEAEALAKSVVKELTVKGSFDGLAFRLPLPRLAPLILREVDNRRSLGEIHAALQGRNPDLVWGDFLAAFEEMREALGGINRLLLRNPTEDRAANSAEA